MFTGIIEELGEITAVEPLADAARMTVRAETVLEGVALGDSIAVNGCCLTVTARTETTWTADVTRQTLDLTTLGELTPGERVNLERAVRADQRLGGHLVQGHVDGVGRVVGRNPGQHWEVVEIALERGLARYLVDQGSVTVDGTSLTVASTTDRGTFTVSLIPETLSRTTLGFRRPGERVNLEVDVLAKYVEKLLAAHLTAPQEEPS